MTEPLSAHRRARSWRLALFLGLVLAMYPARLPSAPDDPAPAGYGWEDLKEIHSRLLRPEKWFFRREILPVESTYYFAPHAFEGEGDLKKGLMLKVMTKVKSRVEKSADEYAAAVLAELGTRGTVLKGWTRKGEPSGPFTTYGLVCVGTDASDGETATMKIVCVANRETDTLYAFLLVSPRGEWKDVEQWGDTMIANLRLDPKY